MEADASAELLAHQGNYQEAAKVGRRAFFVLAIDSFASQTLETIHMLYRGY